MVIYQVHRGPDKSAVVYPEGADPHVKGTLTSIKLGELRKKYELLQDQQGGTQ
jgi:hypothetical protein